MLLIDAPVTPYSPPAEIRAWLDRLRQMRTDVAKSDEDRAAVDRAIERAGRDLERAEALHSS